MAHAYARTLLNTAQQFGILNGSGNPHSRSSGYKQRNPRYSKPPFRRQPVEIDAYS